MSRLDPISHLPSAQKPRYGPLAQLVEHLTFNQVVAGSNPARPTINSTSCANPTLVSNPRVDAM
jgi:hypothetical protein